MNNITQGLPSRVCEFNTVLDGKAHESPAGGSVSAIESPMNDVANLVAENGDNVAAVLDKQIPHRILDNVANSTGLAKGLGLISNTTAAVSGGIDAALDTGCQVRVIGVNWEVIPYGVLIMGENAPARAGLMVRITDRYWGGTGSSSRQLEQAVWVPSCGGTSGEDDGRMPHLSNIADTGDSGWTRIG